MVPRCVENAILTISAQGNGQLSRDALVAYSFIDAFHHYYPSQVTPEMEWLLEEYAWIREREPSRVLKQRRIALTTILREIEV